MPSMVFLAPDLLGRGAGGVAGVFFVFFLPVPELSPRMRTRLCSSAPIRSGAVGAAFGFGLSVGVGAEIF